MDLILTDKNTVEKTYSNAKRFSFLLWPGEKVKTPQQQLETSITSLADLKSRFSVEVVRKQFFDDYIDLFIRLYRSISEDTHFTNLLKQQWVDRVKFTKNLLGKIVFVYFIQKKWWLGIGRDGTWGKGDKNFMRTLWNRFNSGDTFVKPSTEYFYNDYLEHLFYNGFNKDRRDDDGYEPNMRMKVPFLNGGLFKEDYVGWEDFTAKIPNTIFSNGKDGILDIFDTYNFTIDEDDQTDAEVAVDPEMLGKIFEKMISVSHENIDEILQIYGEKWKIKIGKELNKKFWAFYTPREIVHYMTRESLIAYLATNLVGKKEDNEVKIRTLIELKDQHRSRQELESSSSLASIAISVDELLQKVKIIDPAVGSWAFPMGILHEISSLRYYLHSEGFCTVHSDHSEEEWDTTELTIDGHLSMYQIKRETIKNSIYGVDIEPGAIDIARLRFWLSLVVDAEHPEPLPNFEFKFVCANTLIPLDEDTGQKQMTFGMLEEASLKTIKRYKREYYNADTKNEKARIAMKLREYTKLPALRLGDIVPKRSLQIDEFGKNFDNSNHSHSFFNASLMLSEWRGFDIVIGNPPYIKEYDNRKAFDGIRGLPYYMGKMDIWYFFSCLGLDFLKEWGIESFIAQNNWITSFGAKIMRNKILEEAKIREFIDFWDLKVFQDVGIQTMIYILEKTKNNAKYQVKYSKIENKDFEIEKIEEFLLSKSGCAEYKKHFSCIEKTRYVDKTLDFADDENDKILDKIYKQSNFRLEENEVIQWIVGAPDDYYLLDTIGHLTEFELKLVKRYYTNAWKYCSWVSSNHIVYIKDADIDLQSFPQIYNHFLPHIEFLSQNRIQLWTPAKKYFNLHRERDEKFFQEWPKIVCWTRVFSPSFHYTEEEYYGSRALNFIRTERIDLKFLTAVLNSQLSFYWLKNKGKLLWNMLQVDKSHLLNIPIKTPDNSQYITTLVDQILDAKKLDPKADTSDFEMRIDDLVYELYGLTEGEIAVVEGK